jgi:hypothetical protein
MKYRCYTETAPAYNHYGGRGIEVCKEWLESYQNFKAWALNNGYEENLTIDRKDNDGNYTPENYRWITKSLNTSLANKRNVRRRADKGMYYGISPNGEYFTFSNANQFARDNNLFAGCIRQCANGQKKTHYGWIFGFITNT